MNFFFILNSAALGVGLAMDAFSVSAANGLAEPHMRPVKRWIIAGTFACFQFLMPMIGWFCVRKLAEWFTAFQKLIPWIALFLLLFIGGSMLKEGIEDRKAQAENGNKETVKEAHLTGSMLLLQGIATSIDALSVGFTIADYNGVMALTASLIIAAVTYVICICGVHLGRIFGTKLAGKASILGGVILILIGIEIFVRGLLGI